MMLLMVGRERRVFWSRFDLKFVFVGDFIL